MACLNSWPRVRPLQILRYIIEIEHIAIGSWQLCSPAPGLIGEQRKLDAIGLELTIGEIDVGHGNRGRMAEMTGPRGGLLITLKFLL